MNSGQHHQPIGEWKEAYSARLGFGFDTTDDRDSLTLVPTMKVDESVVRILTRAEVQGSHLIISEQLDRKDYERTNKVLEAAGGKWNRKAKAHIFPGDAADVIDQIALTGEVTVPQDFGYFPTPAQVVERLIELADVSHGDRVLEPSAGRGAIAAALKNTANVDTIELQEKNVEALRAIDGLASVRQADFLNVEPEAVYDRVVMNPPFNRQADIRHVMHAARFLKPGGRLVAVMASGVTFRSDRLAADFREFVAGLGGTIEALPEKSFREAGTMVNTVVVAFDTPAAAAGRG